MMCWGHVGGGGAGERVWVGNGKTFGRRGHGARGMVVSIGMTGTGTGEKSGLNWSVFRKVDEFSVTGVRWWVIVFHHSYYHIREFFPEFSYFFLTFLLFSHFLGRAFLVLFGARRRGLGMCDVARWW